MVNEHVTTLLQKVVLLNGSDASWYQKNRGIHTLLDFFLQDVLEEEQIHFTTLFTKLSYICLKYKISKRLTYFGHLHRKQIETLEESNATKDKYVLARYVIIGLVAEITKIDIGKDVESIFEVPNIKIEKSYKPADRIKFARIHVFEYDEEEQVLIGFNEKIPEDKIRIKLNVIGKNDDFNSLLRFIKRRNRFPFSIHLKYVDILSDGSYVPSIVIFEPDYLVDVTTISECFKPNESSPLFYFIKKFFPVFQNKYLIIGNTANYFLDELFYNPDIEFQTLLKHTFRISPLGFSMMSDNELIEVVNTLHKHYYNIKRVIKKQFEIHDIDENNSFLEPSYYSPEYGIQGRLDLFSAKPSENEAKIIELKSGKPYRANSYGLNINHYVQTLLYDLMVDSVFDEKLKISSFILYSSQEENPLKFAPPLKIQQKEAIKLRNQLVEIDYLLADVDTDNEGIFNYINPEYIRSAGFAKRDIELFQKTYLESSALSKKYFNAFTAFVAREQILSKTGEFGLDKSSGLAGLWLDDMNEKIDNFRVLNALEIEEISVEKSHTNIQFRRSEKTSSNANFRQGDLGVLYPFNRGNKSAIKNQIFKCSVVEVNERSVKIRLRNRQNNTSIFTSEKHWHIEHDHLDHGFNSMYQDLFRFLSADKKYQELLLGRIAPTRNSDAEIDIPYQHNMIEEQEQLLKKMLLAEDYFLLWGPPGTGKTSVMLHHFLKYKYLHSDEKVLVLAYTNRAVDEICETITHIGNGIEEQYFRIGSRYSTNEKFVNDLLVTKLEDIDNRKELLELLGRSRIIVSTLASIHGKKEIFSLMKIDTIIVDEASQILEPQLVGFLSFAKKFILIGDHNQLPAIVLQREDESTVKETQLQTIGLQDRRNSLFERLYRRSENRSWDWAVGSLTRQGRMHLDIMAFANAAFYGGSLKTIDGIPRLTAKNLDYHKINPKYHWLGDQRLIYIPSRIDADSMNFKTNQEEAEIVGLIIKQIFTIYKENNITFEDQKIGVITPYRAQISAIQKAIRETGVKERINIDTVERYQGGARDIIVISMCLNIESQLKQLVNLSQEGIDRKLNVAMTRAREQVIVIGNEQIMSRNETYQKLIDSCKRIALKSVE